MIDIKEWKWESISKKESLTNTKTITCPYCNVHVQAIPNTRIVDVSSGAIKHTIHRCPECFMPVIIGLDGKIIPQSQWLPFEDVKFLPPPIESLYNECRKCYQNECYHSVVMASFMSLTILRQSFEALAGAFASESTSRRALVSAIS